MLILAVFTALVGERLSQREVEERVPVDRERLLDFSSALAEELDRLDVLYVGHLDRLASGYYEGDEQEAEEFSEQLAAVKSMSLFSDKAQRKEFEPFVDSAGIAIPEVSVEGQRAPFRPDRAVIIPKHKFQDDTIGQTGWILSPEKKHLVYWSHFVSNRLVAIVVDKEEWLEVTSSYMKEWLPTRLAPLHDSSAHYAVGLPSGEPLYESGDDGDKSRSALVIPIRTHAGEWLIQAWDGVSVRRYRDALTLGLSFLLAAVFLLCGYLLYQQQIRSMRLARKRVSFVNQVSHELGSPLTNMTLNLDLVSESLGDEASDAKKRLGIITEEVGRLNRMVANVLTFSRSERGNLETDKHACCPDDVIVSLLDSFRPALRRRGIEVVTDLGVNTKVEIDSDALTQIIGNLISNVEKYASMGKWMKVKSRYLRDRIVVTVEDRGKGIAENAQKRVFKSFEREQSHLNEGSSGTGLGLAIARKLAEIQGGQLRLLEAKNGCLFELSVPCKEMVDTVDELSEKNLEKKGETA